MFVVWALTDVDGSAAQLDQSLDRFRLVVEGGGRQVEVRIFFAADLQVTIVCGSSSLLPVSISRSY